MIGERFPLPKTRFFNIAALIAAASLLCLVCIDLGTAFADEKMEILIKPSSSEAEVRVRYGRVDVEKSNNAAFHFSIVRPRDSEQFSVPDEAPTPDNNRVMIALFGKTGEAYGVEVDAILLQREMSAADCLAGCQ